MHSTLVAPVGAGVELSEMHGPAAGAVAERSPELLAVMSKLGSFKLNYPADLVERVLALNAQNFSAPQVASMAPADTTEVSRILHAWSCCNNRGRVATTSRGTLQS